MVEFFKSVGTWFVEHKDEILVFFTSGNFAALVTSIVLFYKQLKSNGVTNTISKQLSEALAKNGVIDADVAETKALVTASDGKVDEVQNSINEFQQATAETLSTFASKINAMLEVQQIVYSTIKDESIRKNVQGVLMDAKYAEQGVNTKLQEEINELKEQLAAKTAEMATTIAEVSEKVSTAATAVSEKASSSKEKYSKSSKASTPRY